MTRRQWLGGALGAAALSAGGRSARASIHPDHPRLFFRREAWAPHGLTLADVRARGAAFAESLGGSPVRGPSIAPELAMRYLITGDPASAESAIREMKRGIGNREWTTDEGDQIEAIATAYDWLLGAYREFSEDDRKAIEEILVGAARQAINNLRTGASIFHTRMYAWANGILFAGLALDGQRPEAAELVDFGIRYYKERLIPARRHLGGAWFNAMSYGKKYMCRSVFSMMTAWRSATGEDLWAIARAEQDDWAGNMLLYLIYMLRPDHSFAGYGDIFGSMLWSRQGTMRVVAQATSETRNPYGQGFLKEIREFWGGPCYDAGSRWYQVFEDPSIPSRPRSSLPLARLFGRRSIGMVSLRSGWAAGDTWALFKCGDYGDGHGHFDQGHFEIFRKGRLALDHDYWAKSTQFHNTLLVSDPSNARDTGGQREFSRQIHATLDSYLADPIVRTGDILDYREIDETVYVLGDLTPAYDPGRVEFITRQIVFLERRHFVVFDTVTAANSRLKPRFLLHYPRSAEVKDRRFSWTEGGGQLVGHSILPVNARISAIPLNEAELDETAREIGRKDWPAGRIEVEPAGEATNRTWFLHLLTPCDAGDRGPEFDFAEDGDSYRLTVAGHELVFHKDGRTFDLRPAPRLVAPVSR